MIPNRQKISKRRKILSIGRRYAAGETKEELAKEYEIKVKTVTNYLDSYRALCRAQEKEALCANKTEPCVSGSG